MKLLQIFALLSLSFFGMSAYSAPDKPLPSAEDVVVIPSVSNTKLYGHEAPYLVLTCVDFRLQDEIQQFMAKRGLIDKYDDIVLPGASIGVDNPKKPDWQLTFVESVDALKKLHNTKNVIIMDHRNCGMYNLVYGRDVSKDPKEEYKLHQEHLTNVKNRLKKDHPDLKVELLLMDLDGKVHTVDKLS
jgi:hypothetical protein